VESKRKGHLSGPANFSGEESGVSEHEVEEQGSVLKNHRQAYIKKKTPDCYGKWVVSSVRADRRKRSDQETKGDTALTVL